MARDVPVHYLRPNHAEWSPPSVIVLDTETRTLPGTEPQIEALRLWHARLIDRRPTRSGKCEEFYDDGDTAAELADWVEDAMTGRTTVWLFAHNLSFDLVTTRLPVLMAARGWAVTDAAIGGKSPWLRLAKGKQRLCVVDSWSWLPVSVAELGERMHIAKPRLPADDDTRQVWAARCKSDVLIVAAAITDLMDWWDRNKLGRWTISGPGCGWNAMRHARTPQKVTIDPDPAGIVADRAAINGGRRGVWRVGEQSAGPFLELDFVAAYPSTAAHLPLPVGRKRAFDSLPVDSHLVDSERWGVIAQTEVETDVPRFPVKVGNLVWYPTGRFVTTLAGPDIAEARRVGALRRIGPGHVHQLGYSMQPWAQWCLAVQDGTHPDAPAPAQVAAKAWGRSVIGKWAAHAFDKIELGPSPTDGWGYEEGFDHQSRTRGGLVMLGGRTWWAFSSGEGDNSYPGVLAWVESSVRVRLSRVIEALGPGCVIQADTDGLIVAERTLGTRAAHGHLVAPRGMTGPSRTKWVLDCLHPILAPLTLRLKRTHSHVHVLGPQHLRMPAQRRLAGISGVATEQADGSFTARTWPKLQWQMGHGDHRGYARPEVQSHLRPHYAPGWLLTDGRVVPPAARIGADGRTELVPWHYTASARAGARLAEVQHPGLDALW